MAFLSDVFKETKLVNAPDFSKHKSLLFHRYSLQTRICYSVVNKFCVHAFKKTSSSFEPLNLKYTPITRQLEMECDGGKSWVLIHILFCFLLLTSSVPTHSKSKKNIIINLDLPMTCFNNHPFLVTLLSFVHPLQCTPLCSLDYPKTSSGPQYNFICKHCSVFDMVYKSYR